MGGFCPLCKKPETKRFFEWSDVGSGECLPHFPLPLLPVGLYCCFFFEMKMSVAYLCWNVREDVLFILLPHLSAHMLTHISLTSKLIVWCSTHNRQMLLHNTTHMHTHTDQYLGNNTGLDYFLLTDCNSTPLYLTGLYQRCVPILIFICELVTKCDFVYILCIFVFIGTITSPQCRPLSWPNQDIRKFCHIPHEEYGSQKGQCP